MSKISLLPGKSAASDKKAPKKKRALAAGLDAPEPGAAIAMKGLAGSQTLIRGLDVLEAVASGATNLAALAEALDLNRSTTHRLAATLVGRRYLSFTPRVGYALG